MWYTDWPLYITDIFIKRRTRIAYNKEDLKKNKGLKKWILCAKPYLYPRSWIFFGIFLSLYIAGTILFFVLEDEDASWRAILLLGIIASLYTYACQIYWLLYLLYERYFLIQMTEQEWFALLDLVLLYVSTTLQNQLLYVGISAGDPEAFVGLDSTELSEIEVFYLSYFLAVETLSALGTGSIYANPFSAFKIGFIPIWLNSIQSYVGVAIFGSKIFELATRHVNVRKKMKGRSRNEKIKRTGT